MLEGNSTASSPIWLKFELNQNIVNDLITFKFKRYLTNSNKENVETSIFQGLDFTKQSEKKWKYHFFRCLRAANSVVRGRVWPNFKLIQALMYVIITCKYEMDPIKNNREKVATPFPKL